MKKIGLLVFVLMFVFVGCDNQDYAAEEGAETDWPRLYISAPMYEPRRTIQGVTNWTVLNEDGTSTGTRTDSPHPLQISRENFWPDATISLRSTPSEIEFHFNTPPQSFSVVRWNESHVENLGTQAAGESAQYYESVEASANGITVVDDGYSYIYEVRATWEEGVSYFAFRVIPLPTAGAFHETPASTIFVEDSNGLDDGVLRLLASMAEHGYDFYEIIGANDVVLLQINVQWAERGGTNTDLIARVIEAILAHPDGFTGEIIIADNGQAQFGSAGRGGDLDWRQPNSACRQQSTLDVIRNFQAEGYRVTGVLWDEFTTVRVAEFSDGDYTDGFFVEDEIRHTGLEISYPKFTTEFGTHVSFREGIWDSETATYDHDRLKVINIPVLKSHMLFQQTGAVKGYMGVVSDRLTQRRSHNSVGTGGMGTLMVYTRMPVLNIMDMIWVGPDRGPASSYVSAVEVNMIAASTDPVALDVWTTVHVLIPEAEQIPGGRAAAMNPALDEPGIFGHWLRLSLNEMLAAGYNFTMDENEMLVVGR
ncbi:MAG: DUF362 domain-containing protein [Defluviitaleaceae bacterium]|nr:DUF362 domain-containing protein [Defluviitaleaceae bacterium]